MERPVTSHQIDAQGEYRFALVASEPPPTGMPSSA
jgi:hypothetical protein